jgi:hypothetical protein
MRLCEHLHVQRQGGGGLDFSPGKARWASFRVLEPHVTATKIHRATRVVARVWHLLGRSFVRLYKKRAYAGATARAACLQTSWLISYLYLDNTMASHVD